MHLVVGRIGRPHGLRGEVTVEVRTDDPELRFAPGATLATEPTSAGPLTVVASWHHGSRLVLSLDGIGDRSAAERLRGTLLVVDVDPQESPPGQEEFFDHQLRGLEVCTVAGEPVGELHDVLHLPGQDVLVVRRPDGREALVPFVAAMVPQVDLDAGRVLIDPPPGLLDVDGVP
jgi:16S rRNA processing protein RimM